MYDTIIIGSGPAGLTASIYASRYHLKNLVVGKSPGGTIAYAHKVDNFPGLPGISGVELGQKIFQQAKDLGGEILLDGVVNIEAVKEDNTVLNVSDPFFKVKTETNKEFIAKTLIIATGTERRKLGIPGEKEYLGKGVSYCTNCDAPFFKGKTVVVVGGANAACSGAAHLAEFAKKVYLAYRKEALRADPAWVEEVKRNSLIEVIYNANVVEIIGAGGRVTEIELDVPYNGNRSIKTDGVFIEIGGAPINNLASLLGVALNKDGYLEVDDKMATNISGIFAAGDITTKNIFLPQALTSASEGAIAAFSVFNYLKKV